MSGSTALWGEGNRDEESQDRLGERERVGDLEMVEEGEGETRPGVPPYGERDEESQDRLGESEMVGKGEGENSSGSTALRGEGNRDEESQDRLGEREMVGEGEGENSSGSTALRGGGDRDEDRRRSTLLRRGRRQPQDITLLTVDNERG